LIDETLAAQQCTGAWQLFDWRFDIQKAQGLIFRISVLWDRVSVVTSSEKAVRAGLYLSRAPRHERKLTSNATGNHCRAEIHLNPAEGSCNLRECLAHPRKRVRGSMAWKHDCEQPSTKGDRSPQIPFEGDWSSVFRHFKNPRLLVENLRAQILVPVDAVLIVLTR
jgi:hypothetical protein